MTADLTDRRPDPTADLVAIIAKAAAQAAADIQPRRLPVCLTDDEAATELRVSRRTIRTLVDRGVLRRPPFTDGMAKAVVTTVSVAEAGGWPVAPLALEGP